MKRAPYLILLLCAGCLKTDVDTIGKKEEAPRTTQGGSGNTNITLNNASSGLSVVMLTASLFAIRRRETAMKAMVCGVERYRETPDNVAASIKHEAEHEKIESFLYKKVKKWT